MTIHLNAFDMTCVGHQSPGLWRHPEDQSHRYKDLDYWTSLAQLLERGFFDSLFIADVLGVYDVYTGGPEAAIRDGAQIPVNDPLLAVSAMAAVTSQGRVGWNVVTSYLDSAARNLSLDHQLGHEDGTVRGDKTAGAFADPAKIHPIEHKGKYFSVPGVFLCEPSPQRTPLLFQAGSSLSGLAFAASHAEAVFFSESRSDVLKPKVKDLRQQAERAGRDPRSLKMFPLMTVVTAATDEEARAKYADYLSYVSYGGALALFGGWSGLDLSGYDPGGPVVNT